MRPIRALAATMAALALPTDAAAVSLWGGSFISRRDQQPEDSKYFHEPGDTDILHHYDSRFYTKTTGYEEKRDVQIHMMRAFLDTMREIGLETWLAHGTLLGWWWNGKMLPWDWDIDVQVSTSTLDYLGKNWNGTHHTYSTSLSPSNKPTKRTYLLDINPHACDPDRGDGMNIIDARWIDEVTGLFIDITGLAERQPNEAPGIWSDKNFHEYPVKDLYPMRETMFEGVVTKIPYAYDRMLTEEYGEKALVLTEYEGHRWNRDSKEWIKMQDFM